MSDDQSDKALVRRFQAGDETAFAALIQRHHERIFRLASVMLMTPSHAGDATQDVFLRALTGLKRFRFRAEPFTWLYRTTKNVCQEYNRRDARMLAHDATAEAGGRAVEDSLDARVTARRVRQLVARLPERQRDVVLLRVFEELSVADTATAMRCREGTVKALLHKALERLRSSGERDLRKVTANDH